MEGNIWHPFGCPGKRCSGTVDGCLSVPGRRRAQPVGSPVPSADWRPGFFCLGFDSLLGTVSVTGLSHLALLQFS